MGRRWSWLERGMLAAALAISGAILLFLAILLCAPLIGIVETMNSARGQDEVTQAAFLFGCGLGAAGAGLSCCAGAAIALWPR